LHDGKESVAFRPGIELKADQSGVRYLAGDHMNGSFALGLIEGFAGDSINGFAGEGVGSGQLVWLGILGPRIVDVHVV
jgi:hypothetical protein